MESPPTNMMESQSISDDIITLTFAWYDYLLFGIILGASAAVGLYFGCFGSKQSTNKEYLLGGRDMKAIPVAVSLTVGHVSGITFLGAAGEVYSYGTQYWMCMFEGVIVAIFMLWIYLPVFYNLKVNSSFEYLDLRFDRKIRLLASFIYILATFLYIPIVAYVPAIAFNQVSGIDLGIIAPVICLVCVLYTTIGGLKGVVWADTLQAIITLMSVCAVFIIGVVKAGGFANIWKISEQGDRINFLNINPDPTERTTIWAAVIGVGVRSLALFGVNPSSVQRLMSVSSMKKAKSCLIIFAIGMFMILNICCSFGLMMYARYFDCDPYTKGIVKSTDQMLPYYVMDVARNIPGLPGLFVSGVCTTALSTMSTHLNTVGGSIYTDFIKELMPENTSETTDNIITKCIVAVTGFVCIGMVFVVEHLGSVVQINTAFSGITSGPFLGLFTLGMLCPTATSKGTLTAALISLVFMGWVVIGNQVSVSNGSLYYEYKPLSIKGCSSSNISDVLINKIRVSRSNEELFWIYRISFHWFSLMGAVIVVVFGLLLSLLFNEKNSKRLRKKLYSPAIHKFIREEDSCPQINAECQEHQSL